MSGYSYAAAWLMIALLLAHGSGRAADRFNAAALEIDNPQDTGVDLSAFSQPDSQAAGVYRVDIEINGTLRGHEDVRFARSQNSALQPQFSVEKMAGAGPQHRAHSRPARSRRDGDPHRTAAGSAGGDPDI